MACQFDGLYQSPGACSITFGAYLCGDSAMDSFVGHLDESYCMTENDITDYVRYSRPDLFKRLQQLPVPSSETSFQFQNGQHRMEDSKPNQYAYDSAMCVKIYNGCLNNLQESSDSHHLNLLDLQHKRLILQRLLNEETLILQILNDVDLTLSCSHPHCWQHDSMIQTYSFFVTLTCSTTIGENEKCLHYCLECLEHLFDLKLQENSGEAHVDPFDGSPLRPMVIKAAESIAEYGKNLGDVKNDLQEPTTLPLFCPSNSPETLLKRQQRMEEIEEILDFADHFGNGTIRQEDRPLSPDLQISRPPNIVPWPERYKKQGRTKWDQEKVRLERKKSEFSDPVPKEISKKPVETPFHCYCCEEDEEAPMIKCCSPHCLIGWFHIRCTRYNPEADLSDKFYCLYCKDIVDKAQETMESSEEEGVSLISDTTDSDFSLRSQDSVVANTPPPDECSEDTHDAKSRASILDMTPIASFKAINDESRQLDGDRFDPDTFTMDARRPITPEWLPPRYSFTTITDLAPFMYADRSKSSALSLTSAQAEVFEVWKSRCPRSKLLGSMQSNSIESDKSTNHNDVFGSSIDSLNSVSTLSQMLTEAGGDEDCNWYVR